MIAIDMKMPKSCFECFFYDEYDGFCRILCMSKWDEYINEANHSDYDWKYEKRADICPLVEIEERKVGKWIEVWESQRDEFSGEYDEWREHKCSICDFQEMDADRFNYCPNCGAEMVGAENE